MFICREERKYNDAILVIEEEADNTITNEQDCTFEMRMLSENSIKGIVCPNLNSVDGKERFEYNISGYRQLCRVYENRDIKSNDLKLLLHSLKSCMEAASNYFLQESKVIFLPEYVYMNRETSKILFLYYPYSDIKIEDSLVSLMEFVLTRLDHNDSCATHLAYKIYGDISGGDYSFRSIFEACNTAKVHIEDNNTDVSRDDKISSEYNRDYRYADRANHGHNDNTVEEALNNKADICKNKEYDCCQSDKSGHTGILLCSALTILLIVFIAYVGLYRPYFLRPYIENGMLVIITGIIGAILVLTFVIIIFLKIK